MKKFILFLSILIIVMNTMTACKKSLDAGEQFIKGHLDGQPFECDQMSANDAEPIPGSGPDPTLRVIGKWNSNELKLMLISEGEIRRGTYPFTLDKQRSASLWLNRIDQYYAGPSGPFGINEMHGSGTIIISEITKKYVKGSFDCTLVYNTEEKIIKGQFAVNRN